MKYDITTNKAPEMPNLGKGTECIKLLLSQASKDMHAPLVPMLFPSLAAHISGAEFQYPDRFWKDYSSAEAEYCSIRNGYFSIRDPYCAIEAGYRGGGVLANRLVQFFESIQSIK